MHAVFMPFQAEKGSQALLALMRSLKHEAAAPNHTHR